MPVAAVTSEGTVTVRSADFEQLYELMDLILAGDRTGASELMRHHIEASLPSLGVKAVDRADATS